MARSLRFMYPFSFNVLGAMEMIAHLLKYSVK